MFGIEAGAPVFPCLASFRTIILSPRPRVISTPPRTAFSESSYSAAGVSMRAVIQRVSQASVIVEGKVVSSIGRGLVVLLGIEQSDKDSDRAWMSEKIPNLRIFEDAAGKMNVSVIEVAAQAAPPGSASTGILLVPNFTVAGDARKGRRPSFENAMRPELSDAEFGRIVEAVRGIAGPVVSVQTGVFRADMKVALVNDGPVTICLDSRATSASS